MAVSARQLIKDALQLIRVVGAVGSPTGEDNALGFRRLGYMMGRLNAKRLFKPVRVRAPYSLTDGDGTYTLGPSGSLVGERPNELEHAAIIPHGQTFESPLTILSAQQWAQTRFKAQAGEPYALRYEPTAVNGTLHVVSVPNRAAVIALYHQQRINAFANLDTEYSFEEGYEEVLYMLLAARLAPHFGKSLDPESKTLVTNALGDLMGKAEADAVPELTPQHVDTHRYANYDWQTGEES